MGNSGSFTTLLGYLESAIQLFPDHRTGKNCVRYLIDPVSPQALFPVYEQIHAQLAKDNRLEREYRSVMDTYLMAMDGVWFHSSEEVHCPSCSRKHHRDGRTNWYHCALTPAFVLSGSSTVIAVESEFITPQDGAKKQDCEINAGKRWVAGVGKKYAAMGVTLLCDDLYAPPAVF